MKNIILCIAMTAELTPEDIKKHFSSMENINLHVVYTQIGKANSARALQSKIKDLKGDVSLVVNFGTAGGRNLPNGVYFGTELYEGDMHQEALNLDIGCNLNCNVGYKECKEKIAWTKDKITLANPLSYKISSVKIVSRDAFKSDSPPIKEACISLEEMEAHPLAVTCILNGNIPFFPIKRVSNSVGGGASLEEQEKEFYHDLAQNISYQNPFIDILKNDIIPLVRSGFVESNLRSQTPDKDYSFSIVGTQDELTKLPFANISHSQNVEHEKDSKYAGRAVNLKMAGDEIYL